MQRTLQALGLILSLSLVAALACGGPTTPEERVAEQRAGYTATLGSFVINRVPLVEPEGMADPEAGEEPAGEEPPADGAEASDEAALAAAPVPVRQDAILDILVSRRSREPLPGLTVEIEQVDAAKNVKQKWRVYLDVSDVMRGPGTQVAYQLQDIDFVEGDGFRVEVREAVPPAERGEYRELEEAAGE